MRTISYPLTTFTVSYIFCLPFILILVCGVCCVCIMLSLSYYHNCSRFASLKFAFSCNLYTFQNLSKNLWLFGLFLFAFYAKGELFLLIAFLRLMLFPFVLPLFAPAGTPARISCAAFAGSRRASWASPSDLHSAADLFVLRSCFVSSACLRLVCGSGRRWPALTMPVGELGTVGRWRVTRVKIRKFRVRFSPG